MTIKVRWNRPPPYLKYLNSKIKLSNIHKKTDKETLFLYQFLLGLQNLGLTRGVMSFKLMIPFFKKIDIKKIIFLLKFNS